MINDNTSSGKRMQENASGSSVIKNKGDRIEVFNLPETSIISVLIASVFLGETIIMLLIGYLPLHATWSKALIDSSVLSILLFPVIYIFILRPLKKNITGLKKIKDEIKYESNLLRTLIDNLPDAIYVKDSKCRKIISNQVDVNNMGFQFEEEVLGKDDYDLFPKETADVFFADDQLVLQTGKPILNREESFFDTENQKQWLLTSKVPMKDEDDKVIGLIGIGLNITDRKNEETRLKLLESVITNATDAVAITEVDPADPHNHKIIFVNDAYSKITGYSKEEVIGKTPKILQGPNTDKTVLQRVGVSIQNYQPCEMEVINYKKNGEEFWSSISISPVADSLGNYTYWIAIKRDTTERKHIEQEFIKAKEKAEAGNKAKSEFLANMSHEIRTPLNSVIGFSDLLLKTELSDTQHQYLSAVFQSANSLLDIINEILDFSKIEAGKLEIDIDKTDILELGHLVTDVISFQAYKKNLEVLLNISADVPRFIWIDAVRLRQVLVNLLGNAVKFTLEGEIELKIEVCKKETDEKITLRFSVRDTGIGIAPENQHKIFEAFSQEDASVNRKYGGTGLGLAISKKLLVLMGSELQLKSTPKQGSTFFFELNVKAMDGEPLEWINAYNCKNILIVDDNTNNRLILKDMLALKQITIEEAENGIQALEKISAGKKYDVILMDYHMPELDGLETIRRIRKDLNLSAAEQPIMLLHSSADDQNINAVCRELEVEQRLVKPIKMKQFFESLSKVKLQDKQPIIYSIDELKEKAKEREKNKINHQAGSFKVLVVDDNTFNILLIKTMINNILPNAAIIEAINGKEAVEHFKTAQPDIVFMDIQMPEMNGYEASREIRKIEQEGRKIPIIALTAGTLKDEKERCTDAGMDDYLTKPFVTTAILNAINKWLIVKPEEYIAN